ncbi:CaiB/BaiF CoA transferase family protein [Sphingomonas crocodyli]|uniref:CoA transferase n=1 Tax=Sphingomonas crocodyli TaxID=1979270 RepID=A0A437LWY1_9SPHN|nr:CoA transferase [Sphingomonas crocodyli]RVT89894.1 CoA transferase [Sphingomonas crocodyli]
MINEIFAGVRIVELAQYVFVPGASVLMADHGAEVIHVEPTGTGDPYRTLNIGDGREVGTVNLAMEQNNRGKKSIALDLKKPEGREAMLKLIETADVFLTSLRPKAIRGLGLDIDDLRKVNPKLIYARGNGFGFKGADADRPGFDASAFWARGGLAYAFTPPGQPLTPPRAAFGDHSGSVALAFGIASALYKRAMTGEPSVVDTSLLSTATWMLSADITYSQSPDYVAHNPNIHRFPLMYAYPTNDGRMIQLMLLDPQPKWPGLCKMIGREDLIDDPRFADNKSRMANGSALVEQIAAEIIKHGWLDHWKPIFEAWDAPWELIQTIEDVRADPQVHANGMMFNMKAPDGTEVSVIAGPTSFDGQAGPRAPKGSPGMGEHTEELLRSAGYDDAAIARLKAEGVAQ